MYRTHLYHLGGIMLVLGSIIPLFDPTLHIAAYVFGIGALLFCPIQAYDRYEGNNFIIRRLRRQQVLGVLMIAVTAALMFSTHFQLPPFRGSEWKVTLMIATVLELYTIFRIDRESKK